MKKRVLISILLIILILTGCASNNSGKGKNTGDSIEELKMGGVLNLSSYTPDTMNPLVSQFSCVRDFLYLVYEGLFIVNEDLSVKPVLAKDYAISEGNTVYKINLKSGITFHDGSKFDASDVVATFEYIQNYSPLYLDRLNNVSSYTAKGNDTVIITLKTPQANFVNNLDFPILPSGLTVSAFGNPNSDFAPNGTGRYLYAKTLPYEGIELHKNENWVKSSNVYIPKVNIRFVRDNNAMLYAFNSGEADIITTERGRWGEFAYTGNYRAGEITTTKYTYLGLNTKSSVFSDVEMRRAVSEAIDKETLTDSIMFSHAESAKSPITSKVYFKSKEEKKDIKEKTDFLKSKNLSLYLLYNEESNQKKAVAQYIKKTLEEAGVKVETTEVDFQSYLDRIQSGDYQMYIGEIDLLTDANVRFMFDVAPKQEEMPVDESGEPIPQSPVETPQSASNNMFCNFTSTELDGLIYSMNTSATKNDEEIAYKNFEEYFRTNVIQIPLFHANDAILVNKRLKGKIKTNLTNFYADFGELYIDYKK